MWGKFQKCVTDFYQVASSLAILGSEHGHVAAQSQTSVQQSPT